MAGKSKTLAEWADHVRWRAPCDVIPPPSLVEAATTAGILLLAGDAPAGDALAALQVLVLADDRDKAWVTQASASPGQQTLFLAGSHALQQWAFLRAREHDDVDSLETPAALLVARMVSMLRRQRSIAAILDHERRDPLTGLCSRRMLPHLWEALTADDASCFVFILDLDHFKGVNDRFGHAVGDEILCEVARRMHLLLRDAPLLARLGGEEFVWVTTGEDELEANRLADEVRRRVREPMQLSAGAISITSSIGHAQGRTSDPFDALARLADQAMYEAKARGRDRTVSFSELQRQAAEDDGDVKLVHFQNVAKVITERTANLLANFGKDLVRNAKRDADQDKLTQLWNRRYFDRRFERELKIAQGQGTPLTIAVFDLDHFGEFNRQHGMPTGDAVLATFGRLATSLIRATDWLARYGGEEFVLVVRGPVEEAARVAERIRAELEQNEIVSPTGQRVRATVSVGIAAVAHGRTVDASALIFEGSKRLQQAKREGRNRVVAPS